MTELFLKRTKSKLDPEELEFIDLVIKSSDRMKHLIRDILDFARASNFSSERHRVDADTVAKLAVANLWEAMNESRAEVRIEHLPVVTVNEGGLLRLFQNLIANALKYHGVENPEIVVTASERDSEWVFSVQDNGIGIDPQYHEVIFEPFCRLHGQSSYEGSGLGLSACQQIIETMDGRIWVESEVGHGSTFFFTIPKQAKFQ